MPTVNLCVILKSVTSMHLAYRRHISVTNGTDITLNGGPSFRERLKFCIGLVYILEQHFRVETFSSLASMTTCI